MGAILDYLLTLAFAAVVVLVPAAGVWVASSLAVYQGGPTWLAVVSGALLFPVLPLLWERWAEARRRRKAVEGKRLLGFGGRLVARTLAVNLLFLALLLGLYPAASFAALSARGDWFLEGRTGDLAVVARAVLFRTAGALEGLYRTVRKNRFEEAIAEGAVRPAGEAKPEPLPVEPAPSASTPTTPSPGTGGAPGPAGLVRGAVVPGGAPLWPLPDRLHPLAVEVPAEVETSPAAVARWIAERERDPWQRVKAMHDWVADRIAYDADSYFSRDLPPQDADTVFRRRTAVCAGYANLLAAMGAAAGEEIVVVPGDARNDGADLTGEGHAWSAARIGGRWTLLDATWDAGYLKDRRFVKRYRTSYLFVPPAVIGVTHFPEEPSWQLRDPLLTRGEFFRQPVLKAGFYAEGLSLVTPSRSQVTVEGELPVELLNPRGRFLLADFVAEEGDAKGDCQVTNGAEPRVGCRFPAPGSYRVRLFVGPELYGHYDGVGELLVVNRGG